MSDIVLVILAVVTLGYLGLGIQPPAPDWGSMISDGQNFLQTNQWMAPYQVWQSFSQASACRCSATGSRTYCGPSDSCLGSRGACRRDATPPGGVSRVDDVSLRWSVAVLCDRRRVRVWQEPHAYGRSWAFCRRGRLTSGRVIVDGATLPSDTRGRGRGHGQRRRMSIVFQDPLSALNPVATSATRSPRPQTCARPGAQRSRARALELLRLVGIPDPERRYCAYPHELSGGTRQRVMIAIALSSDPAILLCDEPTTALDVTIQTQILALLADLRPNAVCRSSSSPTTSASSARSQSGVAVMYTGRLVETGPTADVLAAPRHPYTSGLLAAALDVDSPRARAARHPGLASGPAAAHEWLQLPPRCGSLRPSAPRPTSASSPSGPITRRRACTPTCSRPRRQPAAVADALIEVDGLSVSFRAEHGRLLRAVDDVTLRIAEGEVLGLVGESGCGKTTIAKCIAGRVAPTSGMVRFDGRELGLRRATEDRRAIQMVFQDPYSSLNPA